MHSILYECAAPPTLGSAPAHPASSGPKAEVHVDACNKELPQQGQQQPKKEKKAAKTPAASSVPATSGDGLFYRAQLQVSNLSQAPMQHYSIVSEIVLSLLCALVAISNA